MCQAIEVGQLELQSWMPQKELCVDIKQCNLISNFALLLSKDLIYFIKLQKQLLLFCQQSYSIAVSLLSKRDEEDQWKCFNKLFCNVLFGSDYKYVFVILLDGTYTILNDSTFL